MWKHQTSPTVPRAAVTARRKSGHVTYLVASLAVAAKERKLGSCDTVLGSVVIQAFRVDPQVPHLFKRQINTPKTPHVSFLYGEVNSSASPTVKAALHGCISDTHRAMPACSVLWYVQFRVDVLQIPVKTLAFQLVPQEQPPGDVPVGFLQRAGEGHQLSSHVTGTLALPRAAATAVAIGDFMFEQQMITSIRG